MGEREKQRKKRLDSKVGATRAEITERPEGTYSSISSIRGGITVKKYK